MILPSSGESGFRTISGIAVQGKRGQGEYRAPLYFLWGVHGS